MVDLFNKKKVKELENEVKALKDMYNSVVDENAELKEVVKGLTDKFKELADTVANQLTEVGNLTPFKLMREWYEGEEANNEQK